MGKPSPVRSAPPSQSTNRISCPGSPTFAEAYLSLGSPRPAEEHYLKILDLGTVRHESGDDGQALRILERLLGLIRESTEA